MVRWRRRRGDQTDPRRGAEPPGLGEQPDRALPFLTLDDAAEMRRLIANAMAEGGREVVVTADHVRDADGTRYGLWNLGQQLTRAGRHEWPTVVADHVARLFHTIAQDPFDAPDEQLRASTFLRVIDAGGLDEPDGYGYRRWVSDGVLELFFLDLPGTFSAIPDEVVDRLGGPDLLRAVAEQNLRVVPVGDHQPVRLDSGALLHFVTDESSMAASRVLDLGWLLEQLRDEPTADGAIVAFPSRHDLAVHVIRGLGVLDVVQRLAAWAPATYGDTAGAVSPLIHWWRDGRLEPLSTFVEDGRIEIRISSDFAGLLRNLGESI